MSKLEERESRRRSIVGPMIGTTATDAAGSGGRGRPKEERRELKKRISLSVLPSLYEDIQKIAYVQRSYGGIGKSMMMLFQSTKR